MPGRSPPPVMSRRSPHSRGRIIRSPERHHMEMPSTSRGRERREYRPVERRSRSPIPAPKSRAYSPPIKRKATSPIREREISRRSKISKSPVDSRSLEHVDTTYTRTVEADFARPSTSSDRYRSEKAREDKKEHFRGAEEIKSFDIHELRKFTVEIIRPRVVTDSNSINRSIVKPEEIVPVRRLGEHIPLHRPEPGLRGRRTKETDLNNQHPNHVGIAYQDYNSNGNFKMKNASSNEGHQPLFVRAQAATRKERDDVPPEDYRRIIAVDPTRGSGSGNVRERSRERSRYSPEAYEVTRRPVYSESRPERERSPYESRRRSPPREHFIESRERPRERRAGSRDDMRHEVDVRKREERRYSPDVRRSYERESDLRVRINEKRSDHPRVEVREHASGRYESERDKIRVRPRHSPPPPSRERRRGSMERHEPSRSRGDYEREKERESMKRRPHSREREERGREREERGRDREERGRRRYEHSDHYEERHPHSFKTDYEPKKFYDHMHDGHREIFIPPPPRGRGLPIRRGIPPMMRGRGMVRGMNRGVFRGGPMGVMPRGVPRGPFMGMPRFPPRFFPPPF